jgi:hypothetical protein
VLRVLLNRATFIKAAWLVLLFGGLSPPINSEDRSVVWSLQIYILTRKTVSWILDFFFFFFSEFYVSKIVSGLATNRLSSTYRWTQWRGHVCLSVNVNNTTVRFEPKIVARRCRTPRDVQNSKMKLQYFSKTSQLKLIEMRVMWQRSVCVRTTGNSIRRMKNE